MEGDLLQTVNPLDDWGGMLFSKEGALAIVGVHAGVVQAVAGGGAIAMNGLEDAFVGGALEAGGG